jgi:hypothetical protein
MARQEQEKNREKHIEEKRKMKEEINRLEREKAERRAKKREMNKLDQKDCKSSGDKNFKTKESNNNKDPITYYESFSKKPKEFRKLHASSGSDNSSFSSSEPRSDSSDDFPSPITPIKKLDKKNKNTDNLIEKIKDLQRRLNEKDIENKKLKSQLRK